MKIGGGLLPATVFDGLVHGLIRLLVHPLEKPGRFLTQRGQLRSEVVDFSLQVLDGQVPAGGLLHDRQQPFTYPVIRSEAIFELGDKDRLESGVVRGLFGDARVPHAQHGEC